MARLDADAIPRICCAARSPGRAQAARSRTFFRSGACQVAGQFRAANNLALVLIEQPEEAKRQAALELARERRKVSAESRGLVDLGLGDFRLERYREAEQAMNGPCRPTRSIPTAHSSWDPCSSGAANCTEAKSVLEKALETPEALPIVPK